MFILASQVDLDLLFGKIAVKDGLMDSGQVDHLLKLQKDPLRLFIEAIVLSRMIPESDIPKILKDFLKKKSSILCLRFAKDFTKSIFANSFIAILR